MPLMGSKKSGLHSRGQENHNTAGHLQVRHGLRQGTPKPYTYRPLFPGINLAAFWEEMVRKRPLKYEGVNRWIALGLWETLYSFLKSYTRLGYIFLLCYEHHLAILFTGYITMNRHQTCSIL